MCWLSNVTYIFELLYLKISCTLTQSLILLLDLTYNIFSLTKYLSITSPQYD